MMRILLLLLSLVAASPVAASDMDAYAYRQSQGAAAAKAEVASLERAQDKHRPDAARADRLARLTLALDARSAGDFRASLDRVQSERRRLADTARRMLQGPYATEWLNSRWMNSVYSTRDELARELFRRTFADQAHLQTPLEGNELKALRYLLAVDEAEHMRGNAEWLKKAIARNGWFDISRYGAEASQAAWLLVQHSDHDPAWQRSVLTMLEPKTRSGDFQPNYFAYLDDRVAINAGETQRFGTQGRCVGAGDWQPFPVTEPEKLDERRTSVGLDPIEKYRARFTCR